MVHNVSASYSKMAKIHPCFRALFLGILVSLSVNSSGDAKGYDIKYAFDGFDPMSSNPLIQPNPAFKDRIFEYYTDSKFIGKAREGHYCDPEFTVVRIQNFKEYSAEKTESYSYTYGQKKNDFALNLLTDDLNSIYELFEKSGEIVVVKASCITNSISISSYEAPEFTSNFENALKKLGTEVWQTGSLNKTFSEFVTSFGTHFMKESFLGSQIVYEKRFVDRLETDQAVKRARCVMEAANKANVYHNETAASDSFAILSEKCDTGDQNSFFADRTLTPSKVIPIGKSAESSSLRGWMYVASLNPVPIKFELSKISDLFVKDWFMGKVLIEGLGNTDDTFFPGRKMKELFDEKLLGYSRTMHGKGNPIKLTGCGYNNNCPVGRRCVDDLSPWGGYSCHAPYGGIILAGGFEEGRRGTINHGIETIDTHNILSNFVGTGISVSLINGDYIFCGGLLNYLKESLCHDLSGTGFFRIPRAFDNLSYNDIANVTSVTKGKHIWFMKSSTLYDYSLEGDNVEHRTYNVPMVFQDKFCAVTNGSHTFIIGVGKSKRELWMNKSPQNPSLWTLIGDMRLSRKRHACLWFGSTIFITGGVSRNRLTSQVEIIDLDGNYVRDATPLFRERYDHQMAVIEGKPAVIAGGHTFSTASGTIEVYDMESGLWSFSGRKLQNKRKDFGLLQLEANE